MGPIVNDSFMFRRLLQVFRHFEHKNPSIISEDIDKQEKSNKADNYCFFLPCSLSQKQISHSHPKKNPILHLRKRYKCSRQLRF